MLRVQQIFTANWRLTSLKTGKVYRKSYKYAKTVSVAEKIGFPKRVTFFLREGKGWKEVSMKKFREETSQEKLDKFHQKLHNELEEKIKKEEGEIQ